MKGLKLYSGIFNAYELIGPQTASALVLHQCRKGHLPQCTRVEEDYIGAVNVWSIENPFQAIPPIKTLLPKTQNLLREFVDWGGANIDIAKLQVTGRYKHQGVWHQDATTYSSVVALVYLMDEKGFRIRDFEGKEHILNARAGDVFMWRSELYHRGHINEPRMHLHIRFSPGMDYDVERWGRWSGRVDKYTPQPLIRRWKNLANYYLGRSHSNFWQGA